MQFTGEITLGAIGIIASIITSSIGGICTIVMVYAKTRHEIDQLKFGYADVKTDLAKIEGKLEAQATVQQTTNLQLERISGRLEVMGAIQGLPDQLAVAVSKLNKSAA